MSLKFCQEVKYSLKSGIRTDFHMGYGGFSFIFFRDSVTENVTENVTERKLPSHQIVLNL